VPWNHCGTSIKDDVRSCPECGAPKQAWTTKLDKTRTFQIGGDYDPAQAETLEDAQESGSPFCEDCQAADNPADDPDEEEEETDPDTDAQAQALEDAAESGSPFCEDCQKADNEDEEAPAEAQA
jgi:hypothetical protein